MAVRVPRGYDADVKPAYNEISEGVRPHFSNIAIPPYFQLPIFDMDNLHDDPIVLPAGTMLGIKWDGANNGEGLLVPAVQNLSGALGGGTSYVPVTSTHSADETDWNITISGWYSPVYPIGMLFKPIYAFPKDPNNSSDTRTAYENYQREHKVPIVTEYVIQIPARTPHEHNIRPGDTVAIADYISWNGNQTASAASYNVGICGTLMALDDVNALGGYNFVTGNASLASNISGAVNNTKRLANYIVGKCLSTTVIGSDSNGTAGDFLWSALANSRFTKATSSTTFVAAAAANQLNATSEFKNLELIQTVPGNRITGSGTQGVPGFLAGTFGARSDGSGLYRMLTILLRVV